MTLDFEATRACLQDFKFKDLFIQMLGWSTARGVSNLQVRAEELDFTLTPIAQLAGIVVTRFLAGFPAQLDQVRQCLAAADATGVRLSAHALKGSAATLSAGSLHAIALDMESAAGTGDMASCGELLPRAAQEFDRLKAALDDAGWL